MVDWGACGADLVLLRVFELCEDSITRSPRVSKSVVTEISRCGPAGLRLCCGIAHPDHAVN